MRMPAKSGHMNLFIPLLASVQSQEPPERNFFNLGWRCFEYSDATQADSLIHPARPTTETTYV